MPEVVAGLILCSPDFDGIECVNFDSKAVPSVTVIQGHENKFVVDYVVIFFCNYVRRGDVAMKILFGEIEEQLNELSATGSISECRHLNAAMPDTADEKYLLDDTAVPMHFSGSLESNIAFVELNPGRGALRPSITKEGLILDGFGVETAPVIYDVTSYVQFFENFGYYKVQNCIMNNQAISRFDNKQLNFFQGLIRMNQRLKENMSSTMLLKSGRINYS